MERQRQTVEDLISSLSEIKLKQPWRDGLYVRVETLLEDFGDETPYSRGELRGLLEKDFDAAATVVRLILGLSEDEYHELLRSRMERGRAGVTGMRADPAAYVAVLERVGVLEQLRGLASRGYSWRDILLERLRSGRGSALKGQKRGRALEDMVESVVSSVFGGSFEARCSFLGANGMSSEKCDFAIPMAADPSVLIEAKAYGATGSKQTDVLGDVVRIVDQKRHDTVLLLVTDGPTWRARQADLGKLVALQN